MNWSAIIDTTRPLGDRARWLRSAPFLVVMMIALVAISTSPWVRIGPVVFAAVVAVLLTAATALPWQRWPSHWQAVPALGYFALVGPLDYATGGQVDVFYLVVLPIIWLALFHSRRLIVLGLCVQVVTLTVPRLLPGAYPDPKWTNALMAVALSAIGGLAIQHLVARVRDTAAQAQADRDVLTTYLDHAWCLVAVVDRAGRIIYLNRHCEQVIGRRSEELSGQPLWQATGDPEDEPRIRRVVSGEWPLEFESDVVSWHGSRRRIAWTAAAMLDRSGRVTRVVSTGVDITEQRVAERRFANVLDAAVEQMIIAIDTRGTITVFNAGGERMLGYRADELIGGSNERIHVPEELRAAAAEVGAASFQELRDRATADLPSSSWEFTLVRKDGGHVPVAMTITPMVQDDQIYGYVGVARDITAEREAAAAMQAALDREREAASRLRDLDQAKNEFVAMISHDLRTPLTSIIGNTEVMLDDADQLPDAHHRMLAAVDRNARRLQSLIGDLLVLSRIESGTLRLNLRPVPMEEIVSGAMEALSSHRAGDVDIEIALPHQPVLVNGDRDQLERVTINLVSNALKFTPPGGRVEVVTTADPERVWLRVSDTGIGIPAEELPHIFERFFRSSLTQHQERPGTGLGLSIAKSIVDHHGGTIEVTCPPTGGTTFVIELPRLTATSQTSQREPA